MIGLPSDPMALKGRVFDALCEGISDGTVFQRLEAIHSILNLWWFPEWCGVGFSRWRDHPLQWMYRWSILLGVCEVRRWRPFVEAINFYKAREDAIAMEARQGTDPQGLDGEAATARAEGIAQTTEPNS